jgi:YVTN family beta-propeller protein
VASDGRVVAINPVTDTTYVVNTFVKKLTAISGNNATSSFGELGADPFAAVVNPATNKIYVVNELADSVTVLDGASHTSTTLAVGKEPVFAAVNPVTNRIYVANKVSDNVTVINGADNSTTTIAAGVNPSCVAVNVQTNKIYVSNLTSGTVTIIDGASNTTQTVNAGLSPWFVAVNPATNQIFVANYQSANVTVIDGVSNAVTTINVGQNPEWIDVNRFTNAAYVANSGGDHVSQLLGAALHTMPITTTITPLGDNLSSSPTPQFTFQASSTFGSVTSVSAVYFSVDSKQGVWTAATMTESGTFQGTAPGPLSAGVHIVYAYATNGVNVSQGGSLLMSNVAAYLFLVSPAGLPGASPAGVTLSPSSVNFGTIDRGQTASRTVTLTNDSGATLDSFRVSLMPGSGSGVNDFELSTTCPTKLAVGASCMAQVKIHAEHPGTREATLQVSDSDPDSPQMANIIAKVIR